MSVVNMHVVRPSDGAVFDSLSKIYIEASFGAWMVLVHYQPPGYSLRKKLYPTQRDLERDRKHHTLITSLLQWASSRGEFPLLLNEGSGVQSPLPLLKLKQKGEVDRCQIYSCRGEMTAAAIDACGERVSSEPALYLSPVCWQDISEPSCGAILLLGDRPDGGFGEAQWFPRDWHNCPERWFLPATDPQFPAVLEQIIAQLMPHAAT